jgi:hypothetical protein
MPPPSTAPPSSSTSRNNAGGNLSKTARTEEKDSPVDYKKVAKAMANSFVAARSDIDEAAKDVVEVLSVSGSENNDDDLKTQATPPRHVWKSSKAPSLEEFNKESMVKASPIVPDKTDAAKQSRQAKVSKKRGGKHSKKKSGPILVWTGNAGGDKVGTATTEDWPEKWKKNIFKRTKGYSKGRLDSYWYSPKMQYKFRSLREIGKYMKIALETDNDEELAWLMLCNQKMRKKL